MAYEIIHLLRKPGFVVRKVGDARMVIPTGPRMKEYKGVITINETGAFLFELIKEEKQSTELLQALMQEYEIDQDTAFQALSAFVHQCNAAGLLVVDVVEKLDPGKGYYMSDDVVEELTQEAEEINAQIAKSIEEKAQEGESHDA